MKKRILFALLAVVLLLPLVFTGCQKAGGIAQDAYDKVVAEAREIQSKYTDALTKYDELKAEKAAVDTQLKDAQAKVTELENQNAALKAQYELTGATLTETAEKIVKNYHETHVYTTIDYFVCSDMAAEVWNMLKAVGIPAIIAIGNKDTAVNDILQSNHAWVLAEVSPGQYLALETTGGFTVTASANILYYRGWSFDSPADLTANNDLRKEYNVRVGFTNLLVTEVNNAMTLYNNSSDQTEADKWMALYTKLLQLKNAQETELIRLMSEISQLATPLT
jgi:hypothetical protein